MTTAHVLESGREAFARDGFLVVPGMYGVQEIDRLSAWIDELVARAPEVGRQMVYYEDSLLKKGERVLSRIEYFADFHPGLAAFIHSERMLGAAAALLEDEPVLFKEKVNFKLPGGGGFAPHQDIQPGWDDYAPYFLSVLVTVDESTVENGCLELANGHHRRGLLGRRWEPLEGPELAGIEFRAYPLGPGDVVFFDCFAPHQSQPNLTDRPRRNLYLTFNRRRDGEHRVRYFADKRRSFPPDNEREPGRQYTFRV